MELNILLIIIVVLFSAYFAGAETIFLSASKIRIEILFRRNVKGIAKVYSFIRHPESFIVTTLVGNNLTHVLFSTLVVLVLKDMMGELSTVLVSTLILLIFGEIIPKAIGQEFSNQLIVSVARSLRIFKFIFYPFSYFLTTLSGFFVKKMNLSEDKNIENIYTRFDVIKALKDSEKAGIIQSKEGRIINKIFDMQKTRLKDPMVPRTEIFAVRSDVPVDELMAKIIKSGFSRIPVYEETIDHIIGIVYAKDLFDKPATLNDIIKDVMYVPETKYAYELLKELRQKNASIAIVLDEYGGTAGLITLEDLVEELVGEIYDEYDIDHEGMYRRINDSTIVINARAEIDEINERFGLSIEEKETYSTIGGFIIEHFGHIPKAGEVIELKKCRIIVEIASPKQVKRVRIISKIRIKTTPAK